MAWYECLLVFGLIGSFIVLLFFLYNLERRRTQKYVEMLEAQKEFYFWGKQWFYRREMEVTSDE